MGRPGNAPICMFSSASRLVNAWHTFPTATVRTAARTGLTGVRKEDLRKMVVYHLTVSRSRLWTIAVEVQVFSLAPMMEYTDRHMRFLLRLLTKRTVLWTEMVPSPTITHNSDDLGRFLDYNEGVEHPVVLQVCFGTSR